MQRGAEAKAVVWYYRQDANGEPHPTAMEVMKLITANRLPVRLSSKPDFSDSVTPADAGLETMFAAMREKAAQGFVVILRPDGRHMVLPAAKRSAMPPGARQADVLIVDSERLSSLPAGWQETVALVMRKPQILVHDRATHQLRKA